MRRDKRRKERPRAKTKATQRGMRDAQKSEDHHGARGGGRHRGEKMSVL